MSNPSTTSPTAHPLRPKYSWRSRVSHNSSATAEASISRDLEATDRDGLGQPTALDDDGDSDSDLESLWTTTSNPGVSMVGSYRQPSHAAAGSRAFLGSASLDPSRVPTKRERLQARKDEERMLEDVGISCADSPDNVINRVRSRDRTASFSPGSKPVPASESEPLLGVDKKHAKDIDAEWEEAVLAGRIATTWQREAKFLARSSLPLIATYLLQYSLTLASIFTVGHLGTVELGAASLASMTANITGYSAYYGLTTALDTLNAQAYGSGKKALVGLQLQRMVLFLWALSVPIAVVWFFADSILLRIVPEHEVAVHAGLYLKILALGLPAFALYESVKRSVADPVITNINDQHRLQQGSAHVADLLVSLFTMLMERITVRYLQAQGIFSASLYILLIAAPFNVLLNWLFVWVFKWGFVGAPIAVAVTDNILGILIVLYAKFVAESDCWPGFTKRALVNWGPMVRLALPGWIMVEAEVAAFEILTLAASYFGEKALAANSIIASVASVTFQIPFPLACSSGIRIANLIGATLTEPAKVQARVLVFFEAFVGVLNVVVLLAARNVIAKLFTSDEEVIRIVASVVPLLAAFQIFDAHSCNGILRGLGKPSVGGYTQLVCYYLVAMPISMGTAFGLHWELHGLWLGVAVALSLVCLAEYTFIYRFDWEKSVEDARDRNESG